MQLLFYPQAFLSCFPTWVRKNKSTHGSLILFTKSSANGRTWLKKPMVAISVWLRSGGSPKGTRPWPNTKRAFWRKRSRRRSAALRDGGWSGPRSETRRSRGTLVHIPVHAILKEIYIDVFNEPKRLKRDIDSSNKNSVKDYIKAWDYVEAENYKEITGKDYRTEKALYKKELKDIWKYVQHSTSSVHKAINRQKPKS